jgi:hypothetical protein
MEKQEGMAFGFRKTATVVIIPDGWMDGGTDGRTGGWMEGRMDGRTEGRTGGWMEGRTDGWTDGRTDGWMDRGRL